MISKKLLAMASLSSRGSCLTPGAVANNVIRHQLCHPPRGQSVVSSRPHHLSRRSCIALASRQEERTAKAVAIAAPEEPSLYFESFVRCFILGLSAGAAFEAFHVANKFVSLWYEVGYRDLVTALPQAWERFAPLVVNDHIVAVGCWLVLYVIEAVAIVRVLDQHKQNPDGAAQALRTLTTLPRLMLPKMQPFKQTLGMLGKSVPSLGESLPYVDQEAQSDELETTATQTALLAPPKPSTKPRNPPTQPLTKPGEAPRETPPILDPNQEPEGPADVPVPPENARQTPLQKKRAEKGLRAGQLDHSMAELLNREKELADRRSYLQNFWYAAGISEQIKDKPVGVEILGEKLLLVRDTNGVVQCLQDVCPHRGAPLHLGWTQSVKGHDCVVCPYHGWAFDMEGHLRDVPASESSKDWPQKPLIQSYPVQEKGGFVWLFYGSKQMPEAERPPIPMVPELEDPAWKAVYGDITFDCNHWSVFENAIDMAHIHYLHNDSFGNKDMPQIKDMTCKAEAFHVTGDFVLHNKPVNALWEFSKVPEVKVNAKAFLPSTSVIKFTLGRGLSFITFVCTVPISAKKTINRFALVRRLHVDEVGSFVFNLNIWDWFAREAMKKILGQDKEMVEKLVPEMLGREISVKPDMVQIAYRKLRKSFTKMGYGVDPEPKQQRDM